MALVQRQFERKSAKLGGHVSGDDFERECQIADLSPGGAKIIVKPSIAVGTSVELKIGELGPYKADAVWQRAPQTGLSFSDPPKVMAEVLMAVALYG